MTTPKKKKKNREEDDIIEREYHQNEAAAAAAKHFLLTTLRKKTSLFKEPHKTAEECLKRRIPTPSLSNKREEGKNYGIAANC